MSVSSCFTRQLVHKSLRRLQEPSNLLMCLPAHLQHLGPSSQRSFDPCKKGRSHIEVTSGFGHISRFLCFHELIYLWSLCLYIPGMISRGRSERVGSALELGDTAGAGSPSNWRNGILGKYGNMQSWRRGYSISSLC